MLETVVFTKLFIAPGYEFKPLKITLFINKKTKMYKVINRFYRDGGEIIIKSKSNQLINGEIPPVILNLFDTLDKLLERGLKAHECIKKIFDILQPYCYSIELILNNQSVIYEK